MATRHIRAKSASAARKKAGGKTVTVTKVNLLKNQPRTTKGGMKVYSVTTRKKITHTRRGRKSDRSRLSKQSWERRYYKKHPGRHIGKRKRSKRSRPMTKGRRRSAAKKAWATRRRKYGKSGFSAKGKAKIRRNLRKGRRRR